MKDGDVVYNTDMDKHYVWMNTGWVEVLYATKDSEYIEINCVLNADIIVLKVVIEELRNI